VSHSGRAGRSGVAGERGGDEDVRGIGGGELGIRGHHNHGGSFEDRGRGRGGGWGICYDLGGRRYGLL
jgi:hypothetical protein